MSKATPFRHERGFEVSPALVRPAGEGLVACETTLAVLLSFYGMGEFDRPCEGRTAAPK
ncbi:hypothetical protein [Polymorphobacter megasporae]|uniref:hypothetical protein n=1 Tax=Glacieibacterium megasporae TaxID=2835787 RepID=UPI001C1E54D5|nr:hypothetical protein [Polymorphobacter megasporae]UAJ12431.1 hypothetical protein KTC28_21735 [Polymorphobacter megasporae]